MPHKDPKLAAIDKQLRHVKAARQAYVAHKLLNALTASRNTLETQLGDFAFLDYDADTSLLYSAAKEASDKLYLHLQAQLEEQQALLQD